MAESDVARIRKQIELEYQAARRPFTDFTPTARHEFISKRQENIEGYFEELQQYLPPQEAIGIVVQAERNVYNSASSPGTIS